MEVEGFDRMPELTFDFSAKITPSQISDAINKLNLVGHDAIKFYTEDRKIENRSPH